jgi:hypothetical protein
LNSVPDKPDDAWLRRTRQHGRDLKLAAWKAMAGVHYDALLSSADTALSFLQHSTPSVRNAALHVCRDYWKCENDARYLTHCLERARTDPDDRCRESAICALGLAFKASKDRGIQRPLARLVLDSANSNRIRNVAYLAVRTIEDGLRFEYTLSHAPGDGLLDIDWARVNELSAGSE